MQSPNEPTGVTSGPALTTCESSVYGDVPMSPSECHGAEFALTLDVFYPNIVAAKPKRLLRRLLVARIGDYLSPAQRVIYWWRQRRHIPRVPADPRVCWWRDLMGEKHAAVDAAGISTHEPAAILFSGGTTALPKGIVLSNRNFISQGLQATSWGRIGAGDSILAILPIFHGFGLGVCVNAALMAGATSILVPSFDAAKVARLIRRKRPSFLVGVPTLFAASGSGLPVHPMVSGTPAP